MIASSDFEKIFYLYIRNNPNYYRLIREDFFDNAEISTLLNIDKQFHERFNQVPTQDQIKAIIKQDKFVNKVSSNIVDIVFDEPYDSYDANWIQETSESWILWKSLNKSIVNTIEYVKTAKVTPDNVKEIINKVKDLINNQNNITFNQTLGKNFFDAESHITQQDSKITTNHAWVDAMTGGYRTKSLIVYAGELGTGKSIFLANDAVNYVKEGFDVCVVTAEMSETDFIQRIGSNLLDIKISDYEKKSKNIDYIKSKLSAVSNGIIPPGNLFVKEYPTSQVTVPEIEAYLKELELSKGIKLKVVIIDYINILSNYRNPNTENTYMKIKQIAEDLRGMAVRNDWLIVTATQLNRSGFDSTEINIGHIAESAGLGHTADMIYGIIQDATMHVNREYFLKILKVRNGSGKNARCQYRIDYNYMRLIETANIITE